MRSRAVSLPARCCFSILDGPPPARRRVFELVELFDQEAHVRGAGDGGRGGGGFGGHEYYCFMVAERGDLSAGGRVSNYIIKLHMHSAPWKRHQKDATNAGIT